MFTWSTGRNKRKNEWFSNGNMMSIIVFMSRHIFIIMKNLKQVNRTYSLKENFKKKKKTEAVLWGKIVKKEIENRKKKISKREKKRKERGEEEEREPTTLWPWRDQRWSKRENSEIIIIILQKRGQVQEQTIQYNSISIKLNSTFFSFFKNNFRFVGIIFSCWFLKP